MKNTNSYLYILLILISSVLINSTSFAGGEISSNIFIGNEIRTGLFFQVEDNKYDQINSGSTLDFKDKQLTSRIILGVDQNSKYYNAAFDLSIIYQLNFKDTTGTSVQLDDTLSISFDPDGEDQYIDRAVYQFDSTYRFQVKILSITYNDTTSYTGTLPENIFFEGQIISDRYYDFASGTAISNTAVDLNYSSAFNELTYSWNFLKGAEYYDIEWTYIDNYDATGGNTRVGVFDFDNNSTRVRVANNSYAVPLIFDRGNVLFRIRGVGIDQESFTSPVTGVWSTNNLSNNSLTTFTSSLSNSYHLVSTAHESTMNWHVASNFAEDGKRKTVVQYVNGSNKVQQIVTNLNSQNATVVQEKIYDFNGRESISVLPLPLLERKIDFKDSVAVNDQEKIYSKLDFDVDTPLCVTTVQSMGDEKGVGKYYSSANDIESAYAIHNAFIPDANGYPFSVTEFTPDKTGRIRRQSNVGAQLNLNGDQATNYYYGKPSQDEIDRLFGSEVGFVHNYQKNMVIDPNGQATINYIDREGRTIATALAGSNPITVLPLMDDSIPSDTLYKLQGSSISTDLLYNDNSLGSSALVHSSYIQVPENEYYEFEYLITRGVYEVECSLDSVDYCFNCVYNLDIFLIDNECSDVIFKYRTKTDGTIGSVDTNITSCASLSQQGGVLDSTFYLSRGSYTLIKVLSVNNDAKEEYLSEYLTKNQCLLDLSYFEDLFDNEYSDCEFTCQECIAALDTAYANYSDSTQAVYISAEQYNLIKKECQELCFYQSNCEASYQMMLDDVSPGGQYGKYSKDDEVVPELFYLSVFNDENSLVDNICALSVDTPDWRHPDPPYQEVDGSLSIVYFGSDPNNPNAYLPPFTTAAMNHVDFPDTTADGYLYWYPEDLLNVEDLVKTYWKPSWAKSLVKYHPEYCYYEKCDDLDNDKNGGSRTSHDVDSALFATEQVPTSGNGNDFLLDPMAEDPFWGLVNSPKDWEKIGLRKFHNYLGTTTDSINMYEAAYIITHCANIHEATIADLKTGTGICLAGVTVTNPWDYITGSDEAWITFRNLYFSLKQEVWEQVLEANAISEGCYNGCIGTTDFNPYGNPDFGTKYLSDCHVCYIDALMAYEIKSKRFPSTSDVVDLMAGEGNAIIDSLFSGDDQPMMHELYRRTGMCPVAFDLKYLFDALAADDTLKNSVSFWDYPNFSKRLYDKVKAITPGLSAYTMIEFGWSPNITTGAHGANKLLDATIVEYISSSPSATNANAYVKLDLPQYSEYGTDYNWNDYATGAAGEFRIKGFGNLKLVSCSDTIGDFLMNAYITDFSGNSDKLVLEVEIKFSNICGCTFSDFCKPSAIGKHLRNFFNVLANRNGGGAATSGTNDFSSTSDVDIERGIYELYFKNFIESALPDTGLIWKWRQLSDSVHIFKDSVNGYTLNIAANFENPGSSNDGKARIFTRFNQDPDGEIGDFIVRVDDWGVGDDYTVSGSIYYLNGGDTIPIVIGNCSPPRALNCNSAEHIYRDDLEDLLNVLAVKSFLDTTISMDGFPMFNQKLKSVLGTGSFNYVYDNSQSDGLNLFASIEPNNYNPELNSPCELVMSFVNEKTNKSFSDIVSFTDLYVNESILSGTSYLHFSIIAHFADDSTAYITGSSCFPLKNCIDCDQIDGEDLVYNGSFTLGDTSFTSELDVSTDTTNCSNPDYYTITKDANKFLCDRELVGVDKWDAGTGQFLLARRKVGASPDPEIIWSQTISSIQTNTEYEFGLGYINADAQGTTGMNIILEVNGMNIQSYVLPINAGVWKNAVAYWYSATDTSCTLKVKLNTVTTGSDTLSIGIDDIYFKVRGCDNFEWDFEEYTDSIIDPCPGYVAGMVASNSQLAHDYYLIDLENEFETKYVDTCLAKVTESLTVNYDDAEYQYTLYYYDRAGNLVRTVPPAGVERLDLSSQKQDIRDDREDDLTLSSKQAKVEHTLLSTYKYNTLNKVIWQKTPDGGETNFWYDRAGRLVLSQNAKQASSVPIEYTYTIYDALNRVKETGEIVSSLDLLIKDQSSIDSLIHNGAFPTNIATAGNPRQQVTRTYYDQLKFETSALQDLFEQGEQSNLRNRVSHSTYIDMDTDLLYPNKDLYDFATHYSYDIHGNVKELVQEVTTLDRFYNQKYKKIAYQYDLISGNVLQVNYQQGERDQYFHKYRYDDDNRLTHVYTSRDGVIWDQDAKYFYYLHGPLARAEIGRDKVQGLDYIYTLQGWLKGINGVNNLSEYDIGMDGDSIIADVSNTLIGRDEYGIALNYFTDDYEPIKTASENVLACATQTAVTGIANSSLYNGNIRSMLTSISEMKNHSLGNGYQPDTIIGAAYSYDQLNRLQNASYYSPSGSSINDFNTTLQYDQNGNILTLNRNGYDHNSLLSMDDLTYNYYNNRNQLKIVNDIPGNASNYSTDIDNSTADYQYDLIGNLVQDLNEEIDTIKWNLSGKVSNIIRTTTSSKSDLEFHYDAMGNRVIKIQKPRNSGTLLGQEHATYTYYIRDAQGQVMATYNSDFGDTETTPLYEDFSLIERPIYGSSRLGIDNCDVPSGGVTYETPLTYGSDGWHISSTATTIVLPDVSIEDYNRYNGKKSFELSNHLGNVLVVVSDNREWADNQGLVDFYKSKVLSANDYYPFGSLMPGRSYSPEAHKYGYQGSEKDVETNSVEGAIFTTFYRQGDTRLARWWSIDPVFQPWQSPYNSMDNNPILYNDVLGDEVKIRHKRRSITYKSGKLFNSDGSKYTGKGVKKNGELRGFLKTTVNSLNTIAQSQEGKDGLEELQASQNIYTIVKTRSGNNEFVPDDAIKGGANQLRTDPNLRASYEAIQRQGVDIEGGSGGKIYFNPKGNAGGIELGGRSSSRLSMNLAHELVGHGLDANRGLLDGRSMFGTDPHGNRASESRNEWQAVYRENLIRKQLGLPLKEYYRSKLNINTGIMSGAGPRMLDNNDKPIKPDGYR